MLVGVIYLWPSDIGLVSRYDYMYCSVALLDGR